MIERQLAYDPEQRSGEIAIHAWLLICSWGFLIPTGTLIWSHTKKYNELRPYNEKEGPHPHIHMLSGLLGVILAVAGFAYGIDRFTTLSREPRPSTHRIAHAVIGTIATAGMMLQVVLMALMRKPTEGETSRDWPLWRKIGHRTHRYFGYLWIAFGLVACETGTHISSVTSPQYLYLGLDHEGENYSGG